MTETLTCWVPPCEGVRLALDSLPWHDATFHPVRDVDRPIVNVTIQTRRPEAYVLVDLDGRSWMIQDGMWIRASNKMISDALASLHMSTRRPPGTPGCDR